MFSRADRYTYEESVARGPGVVVVYQKGFGSLSSPGAHNNSQKQRTTVEFVLRFESIENMYQGHCCGREVPSLISCFLSKDVRAKATCLYIVYAANYRAISTQQFLVRTTANSAAGKQQVTGDK